MPEVVLDLLEQAELVEVVRGQAAQGEPVEIAATGKHHDQQNGEQKRRNGVADDDRRAGPDVEVTAVSRGLGDPQGDRHQVHDQGAPQPEGDGHRHLLDDQVGDLGVAEEAFAKVQVQVVDQHDPEALGGRLVEAVHAFDLAYQFRVQALGAAVIGAGHRDLGTAAGDAAGGAVEAFQLGDHLLHRAAGCGLDDQEVDQQDAKQGGNDQQQPSKDIRQHLIAPCLQVLVQPERPLWPTRSSGRRRTAGLPRGAAGGPSRPRARS